MELWRVITKPKIERPESFGSMEYFHRDQHCENPNPDLLTRHGMTRKVGASGAQETAVTVVFHHVVEREFMLRMCPCVMSHCTCETISPGSQVCSKIIEVDNPAEDQVFSWCRGLAKSPAPKIDAPTVQHCPAQLRITGVLPSCTTVQDYDQVEVILQAYYGEPTNCNQRKLQELITSTALDKIVKLNSINKTHGSFDVDIENITQNVYYCVRVELVNHPYCNSGSDGSLDRQTKICRPALWNEPIYIASHSCGAPPPCPESRPNLPLITGASLTAALVLAIGLVLVHRIACRRKSVPRFDQNVSDRLLQPVPSPQYPDVFFLYFCDSEEFVTVNKLVVRWLTGLGHRVIDLSDEMLQEELISAPETWIVDKLEEPSTKVVLVTSDLATNNLNTHSESEAHKDNMNTLRLFSLRHIHQRLATNYRRLAVIQYTQDAPGAARSVPSLVPHTRHTLPDHLPELQAWLAETHGWDDNENMESVREQTLRDLKAAVQKYTSNTQ